MTTEHRLVEYGDFDIEAAVRIAHAIRPDSHESVADHIEWHVTQRSAGYFCSRWLVLIDGQLIGSAYIGQSSVYTLPHDVTTIYVAVHPDHQNRGHGRTLLERAETTASDRGNRHAYSWSDETQPRSTHFLKSAGYREIDRGWESSLDLSQCDLISLGHAVDRVVSTGIRIAPVSALASERENWKEELHQLYVEIESGVPTPFPIQRVPFKVFEAQNLGHRLVSGGFLVALDGEQLVGLTEPQTVDDAPREISQNLTGVLPEYRGRGIAMALKSQALAWAIESGYTSVRTHSAQSNSAMLGINNRLGFQRSHATMVYLRDL